MSKRVSAGTANQKLLIMRGCWSWGARLSLVTENPFKMVEMATGETTERRAFTVAELQELLKVCDAEWRAMVLLGLYTGQRLGDLASLTWRQVDFEQREIKFLTQKTKRRQIIPMAKPLSDYLLTLPSSDNPDAPVMPGISATATGTLSRQFGELLHKAGLVKRETSHRKRGAGRDARRVQSEITFHSLRHTATTLLKTAGVSDAITREIIGHDSTAVSRGYTHIETATLRKAVDSLGDVLKVTP
jgi:integrase